MAKEDNSASSRPHNARVQIVTSLYEAEVLSSTIGAALQGLQDMPKATAVREELSVISKLAGQLIAVVDELADAVRRFFASATQ